MANQFFPTNPSSKVAHIWDDDTTLSDEGGYFVATNPTPGTGIAQTICVDDAATASSTHAQFAPTVLIYNNANANSQNAPSLYLRYVRLLCTAAPASATSWQYSLRMDPVQRYSSGGSLLTPVQPNPLSIKSSQALVYFGAIVPTALPSANARLVGRGQWNSAIPVVGDQYSYNFGAPSGANDMLSGGATAKNATMWCPPVVIPPGWSLAIDQWGPSNAATPASWEVEMGWVERVPGL